MNNYININKKLMPLAFLYGIVVEMRNWMFDIGLKRSHKFSKPIIGVGNITVGGTGKTPHVEYLIGLLQDKCRVAVLSRGYKRKSKGFVLADESATCKKIGDEPWQMYQKFPKIQVAVDANRCHGVKKLKDAEVILLDDSYQHRYITPGINILLVDSNRMIGEDKMLPVGRLREHARNRNRADIIILTKCSTDLKPIDYRVLTKTIAAYPYQKLFFTTFEYKDLRGCFHSKTIALKDLKEKFVMPLCGIAVPEYIKDILAPLCKGIIPMPFADHHQFTASDIKTINSTFASMPQPSVIITTEKDESRIKFQQGWSNEVKEALFVLPIEVKFLNGGEDKFNKIIIDYVTKNTANSIVAQK